MRETWTWRYDQHGHHIRPVDSNDDCVAHTLSLPRAEQIVVEHNAVAFAIEHGKDWVLEDWRNWLKYHARGIEQETTSATTRTTTGREG